MRLPLTKVYRAFPQLDIFSDTECRRYVSRARADHRLTGWLVGLGMAVIALPSFMLGFYVAFNVVEPLLFGAASRQGEIEWLLTVGGVWITIFSCGMVLAFLLRDRWLRWAVRSKIDTSRCTGCKYALLGLPIEGDTGNPFTICPECGERNSLKSAGLSAEDLLSPATPSSAASG